MPFMKWVKTPNGYEPVKMTDEEVIAENTKRKAEREKMERIREQFEIVNDKNLDRIKDSIPVPKVEPVNCKDCDDRICCEKGKDQQVYCPRCFERKEKNMWNYEQLPERQEMGVSDHVVVAVKDEAYARAGYYDYDAQAWFVDGCSYPVNVYAWQDSKPPKVEE